MDTNECIHKYKGLCTHPLTEKDALNKNMACCLDVRKPSKPGSTWVCKLQQSQVKLISDRTEGIYR